MKKQLLKAMLLVGCLLCNLQLSASPVHPGVWKVITLTDGTKVNAQLIGDEWLSFYRDSLGNVYTLEVNTPNEKLYALRTAEHLRGLVKKANASREPAKAMKSPKTMRKAMNHSFYDGFRGKKRGLIILANFKDKKYCTTNPKAFFSRVANKLNFTQGNYKKSVRDYFLRQSYGRFDIEFDVIGPVELPDSMAKYGAPEGSRHDVRAAYMVRDAVYQVEDSVDFSDYDWDGDDEVDNIFVLYAGYNQAEGGSEDTVWPHKWTLSAGTGSALRANGVRINTYACSSELRGSSGSTTCGIGTICHEFSHCMGFPDLYDTSYSGNVGVGTWDVMGSGSYRGGGYDPMDYSGFEKWTAGWLEPIELTDPIKVKGMKPTEENGEVYVIYADNPSLDECYILENRDVSNMYSQGAHPRGLLISHIDYNEYAWYYNKVNTFGAYYEWNSTAGRWETKQNNHMRWRVIAADGRALEQYRGQQDDVFPYISGTTRNDQLTATSTPQMVQWNGTDTAQPLTDKEITDIVRNADGTIDFTFRLADDEADSYQSLYLDVRTTTEPTYPEGTYNVNTNRMFPNGEWTTLWLPFSMSDAEVKEALGDNTKVAKFTGVTNPEAGKYLMDFTTTTDGIEANVPCIVKVENSNYEYTELGLLMRKDVTASTATAEQTINGFTFKGVKKAGNITLNSPSLTTHGYLFNEGFPATYPQTAHLDALQAYFVTENEGEVGSQIDVATAINGIEIMRQKELPRAVYHINGQQIKHASHDINALPKGIYIIDGKKVVRK